MPVPGEFAIMTNHKSVRYPLALTHPHIPLLFWLNLLQRIFHFFVHVFNEFRQSFRRMKRQPSRHPCPCICYTNRSSAELKCGREAPCCPELNNLADLLLLQSLYLFGYLHLGATSPILGTSGETVDRTPRIAKILVEIFMFSALSFTYYIFAVTRIMPQWNGHSQAPVFPAQIAISTGTAENNQIQCPGTGEGWAPGPQQARLSGVCGAHRGRDTRYRVPPAQIPACGITAPGSSELLALHSIVTSTCYSPQ